MSDTDRRRFIQKSAAIVSGLAIGGCRPEGAEAPGSRAAPSPAQLAARTLSALGRVVLPRAALGEDGVARVVEGFQKWLDALEPGAELDHPYIFTDEIPYGPASPGAVWAAQLELLELESARRHGRTFDELSLEQQEALLRDQLPAAEEPGMPEPARAGHVALGLLAYFYQSPEANDLCYDARIERHSCRGLESAPRAPSRS